MIFQAALKTGNNLEHGEWDFKEHLVAIPTKLSYLTLTAFHCLPTRRPDIGRVPACVRVFADIPHFSNGLLLRVDSPRPPTWLESLRT